MTESIEDKFNPFHSTNLFGYSKYFTNLSKLYEIKKFPKVVLISGEKGLGKFTFVFHLINFFFTYKHKDNSYDLQNFKINLQNEFYTKILSNINENFVYINKSHNKKSVSIEDIREIKKKFYSTMLNDLPRFIVLDDVDQLNVNSANALLKQIEEPSNLNYFILINNKRKKIIDTLKSRALEFKIFLNKNDKVNILNNIEKKFQIDLSLYKEFSSKFTPGRILRVCDCLNNTKIDYQDNLYKSTNTLLDKFKKNKDEIYLETIKFLLDVKINKQMISKKQNVLKILSVKKNLNKILYDYEIFNISKDAVLESFKELPEHV